VESTAAVREFVRSLGLLPKDEFHTTVFYNEEWPLYSRSDVTGLIENVLPLVVEPSTYALELFGGGVPALTYTSPRQVCLREELLAFAVRHLISGPKDDAEQAILEGMKFRRDFAESPLFDLNPHITLSKEPAPFDPKQFTEPLVFDAYRFKQNLEKR
jgi:hypothetical protein